MFSCIDYFTVVHIVLLAYVVGTSLRLSRIVAKQVSPIPEVFAGWTMVFFSIGAIIYPLLVPASAGCRPTVLLLMALPLAIMDLWLFESKKIQTFHQAYRWFKWIQGLLVVISLLLQ